MKRTFGKLLLAIFFAVIATNAMAQEKGDTSASAIFAYGIEDGLSSVGIGVRCQWNVLSKLRLAPEFTSFFERNKTYVADISANAHYLFPVNEKASLYPLAGVGMMFRMWETISGADAGVKFGPNVGAGLDLKLNEEFTFNMQMKYLMAGEWKRFTPSITLTKSF